MNCACGCGTSFEPSHWRRRFFEDHRFRVPGKTVPIRVPTDQAPKIKARLSRRNGRNNGVQRTDSIGGAKVALEREMFHQAALWLKNRLDQKRS